MPKILIPPPRVALVDLRTGQMNPPWFAFFAQFLQTISDDTTGAIADLTLLTGRVTVAESDVDALQSADIDFAAVDAALAAADRDLMVDDAMAPDRSAEIDALRKRIDALELEISALPDRGGDIQALAKRLRDLETDQAMR
jgi:uncharacterized protein (DUF3084 family)